MSRPLPNLPRPPGADSELTDPFWSGLADGRLCLQRCGGCAEVIWYPRSRCPRCHSDSATWFEAAGTGTIYSFTIVRKGSGAFAGAAPYVVAYVELTEGPRVLTNIVDAAADELTIGAEVEAVFDSRVEALLRFRLAGRPG